MCVCSVSHSLSLSSKSDVAKLLADSDLQVQALEQQRVVVAERAAAGAELARRVAALSSAVAQTSAVAQEVASKVEREKKKRKKNIA